MNDEDNSQDKLELSPTQVAGSALAAVSGAFFASWAGTAGTLIGVAATSVVATVGAATYTWWLRRTRDAVRRTAAQVRQTALLTNALPRTVGAGPLREGQPATQVLAPEETVDGGEPDTRSVLRRWDLPWRKVLLTSVAVMFVALATITGFEAITGRSVASYAGQDDAHGSTLGNAFDSGATSSDTDESGTTDSDTDTSTDAPTQEPTQAPSDDATTDPGTGTGGDGTGSEPTQEPTPTPSADPTTTPSAEPTPDTGTGD